MAIQTRSLTALEHDWFATRSGLPTQSSLNEHKIEYFCSKGFKSTSTLTKPVTQLEEEWLNSIAGRICEGLYELWVAVCQNNSVTVGKSVDECKRNFYNTIASGTNP